MRQRLHRPLPRSVVFVGLMGVGKTAVGRRVAGRLGLPFVDGDKAIEEAAGMSVSDIFATYGEAEFRDLERRVMARLLEEPLQVIATGGGAYMNADTRQLIADRGISVWLRADLDTLVDRTTRRDTRPLLRNGDPRAILARLMAERDPVYAGADLTVDSAGGPPDRTVDRVVTALNGYLGDGLTPPPRIADRPG